jgi:hypothetical protein
MLRPDDNLIQEDVRHDSERIEKIEENGGAWCLFSCLDIADEALDITGSVPEFALAPSSFVAFLAQ